MLNSIQNRTQQKPAFGINFHACGGLTEIEGKKLAAVFCEKTGQKTKPRLLSATKTPEDRLILVAGEEEINQLSKAESSFRNLFRDVKEKHYPERDVEDLLNRQNPIEDLLRTVRDLADSAHKKLVGLDKKTTKNGTVLSLLDSPKSLRSKLDKTDVTTLQTLFGKNLKGKITLDTKQ